MLHSQGMPPAEIARRLQVTRQTVHAYLKGESSAPVPVTTAQVVAMVQAAQQAESAKVVPIRPDLTIVPPEIVPTPDEIKALAMEGLRVAIQAGDPRSCMWVLERIDPETFGTAADKKTIAELRKTAEQADTLRRPIVVRAVAAPKREAV